VVPKSIPEPVMVPMAVIAEPVPMAN